MKLDEYRHILQGWARGIENEGLKQALFTASKRGSEKERDAFVRAVGGAVMTATDPVNSPAHYTDGGIETIDYLQAKLTPEEFRGFCKGNALKYLSRAGKKGDASEDIRKAIWYLKRLEVERSEG